MLRQNLLDIWDNEKNEIKNPSTVNLKSGKFAEIIKKKYL